LFAVFLKPFTERANFILFFAQRTSAKPKDQNSINVVVWNLATQRPSLEYTMQPTWDAVVDHHAHQLMVGQNNMWQNPYARRWPLGDFWT